MAVLALLTWWHLKPLFPAMATMYPGGGTDDVQFLVGACITTGDAILTHPWSFWRGDRLYPYTHSTMLSMVDFPLAMAHRIFWVATGNALLALNLCIVLLFFVNATSVYALAAYCTRSSLAGLLAAALCAFFPHRVYGLEPNYQDVYAVALALLAWQRFLERGTRMPLALFFGAVALKATAPDYQAIFMFVLLAAAVPLGLIATPGRLRASWKALVVGTALFAIAMAPFIWPYVAVFSRLKGHGVQGVMMNSMAQLSGDELVRLCTGFFHNVTHVRERLAPTVFTPLWPGIVALAVGVVALLWTLASPLVLGRRALPRLAYVIAGAAALLIVFANCISLGEWGSLSRLYVDPPLLAVVRGPRAFLYSFTLCLGMVVGLATGDLLRALHARSRWLTYAACAALGAVLLLATLEHTVAFRPFTAYDDLCRPAGVYAWLKGRPYPSPYVEFPNAFNVQSYHKLAYSALSRQPSSAGHSRYILPLQYFLHSFDMRPATDVVAMVAVSPYRYLVKHDCDDAFRHAALRGGFISATNFGATWVFENPQPGRTSPQTVSFSHKHAMWFPTVAGALSLDLGVNGQFAFVPEQERAVRVDVTLLDGKRVECGRLKLYEELPYIIEQRVSMAVRLQYDPRRGRMCGSLLRPFPWRHEKAPMASCAMSEDEMAAVRWLQCRAYVGPSSLPRECDIIVPVDPLHARWPYKWGTPVSYAYQAGGFDTADSMDGTEPVQCSVGDRSMLYLTRPAGICTGIVLRVKNAVVRPPRPLSVHVSLNGTRIGTHTLAPTWQDAYFTVPDGLWRDINRFDFEYPRTYVPWSLTGKGDELPRCAMFASLMCATSGPPVIVASVDRQPMAKQAGGNMVANPRFDQGLAGWHPWHGANMHTDLLSIVECTATGVAPRAVRIRNPQGNLVGIQQVVPVVSGQCYRLSGWGRSIQHAPARVFGGRIGFRAGSQKESSLLWMTMKDTWLYRETVVTNMATGIATIFVHVGYGSVASTGEFAAIRLERLEAGSGR